MILLLYANGGSLTQQQNNTRLTALFRDYPGGGRWKRKYGKGKYETAHFARMENASTENATTMQTFSQIKKGLVLHKF